MIHKIEQLRVSPLVVDVQILLQQMVQKINQLVEKENEIIDIVNGLESREESREQYKAEEELRSLTK